MIKLYLKKDARVIGQLFGLKVGRGNTILILAMMEDIHQNLKESSYRRHIGIWC